jgi:hypothetical protein
MYLMKIVVMLFILMLFGTCTYAADCSDGGRYEDMGDGTVQDCRTGLIWLKNANCTDSSNGVQPDTTKTLGTLNWYDAMKWVAGLSGGDSPVDPPGPCGLTDLSSAGDWRLPTKTEWMAMIAYAKSRYTDPVLTNGAGTGHWTSGDVFTDVQSYGGYWTSTTVAQYNISAWFVQLYSGGYMDFGNKVGINFVWPVRAGQSGTFGSLRIE